jgi:radical SAM-linked protein
MWTTSYWTASFASSALVSSRIQIVFAKGTEARFLSHHDLMATWEYALRRGRLPVALSEGYTPRPRISLAAPLPTGYLGERELAEVVLREPVDPSDVVASLRHAFPAGITVLAAREIDAGVKPAAARLGAAVYRAELAAPIERLTEQLTELMDRSSLIVDEERTDGQRRRDVRSSLLGLWANGDRRFWLRTRLGGEGGTARPEHVLQLLELPDQNAVFIRESIELND